MTKSWDSYYVVFLSGILSTGIPLGLSLVSWLFSSKKKTSDFPSQPLSSSREVRLGRPAGPQAYQSINVRFFLAANAALVLITLALELLPCAATLQAGTKETLTRGLIAVISLASFAALGLIYATKKGNMDWLPSSYIKNLKLETKSDSEGDVELQKRHRTIEE